MYLRPATPYVHPCVASVRVPSSRNVRGGCRRCKGESKVEEKKANKPEEKELDPEDVAKKFGLEAGLFKAFTNKNEGGVSAKDLLQRYGGAYLLTSVTLAAISFTLCYLAIDSGVDVRSLLTKIGITVSADSAQERAGTLALAYTAHKALSPVRFPPTVVLTPIVANFIGKKGPADDTNEDA